MLNFKYKFVTKEGKLREGHMKALMKGAVVRALKKDGGTVLLIQWERGALAKQLELPSFGFSKIERINFFRNLSTMLASGLSLASALRVVGEQMKSKKVRRSMDKMALDVENGQKLSATMASFPGYFSAHLVETVGVGEVTGELAETLDKISVILEGDLDLSRKVVGAIAYPVIVICVMVLVSAILMVYVLPHIAQVFAELDAQLPLPTRILLGVSVFLRTYPFVLVAGILACIGTFIYLRRNKKTRYALHYMTLKLPIFGLLVQEFNLARFFRNLEALVGSGTTIVRAIEIAKKTLRNDVYRRALDGVQPVLTHGVPLTEAMAAYPVLFPVQTRRILEVGEKTGRYEETFDRVAGFYERIIKHKTQILASIIEPLLIIVIGVLLGGLALSIFMPLYQVVNVI